MAAEGDWQNTKTVAECLGHLCLSETMSDVVFTFPDSDARVHAHKVILGMRSAVFEAMFYGPVAEKGQEIKIQDGDEEAFGVLLRYIYTDAADLKGSTVLKCLYAGRKYCVDGFVQACSTFLETSISVENVLTIYEHACHFDMPDLQARCMKFIAGYSVQVLKSEELVTISNKTLVTILDRDDLNAKETSIFEAAVKWAKHQCAKKEEDESPDNMRRCLGDAFYCIRLPIIPMQAFAETVSPSRLLSMEEEVELYRYIATASNTDRVITNVGKFKVEKRKPQFTEVFFKQQHSPSGLRFANMNTNQIYMSIVPSSPIKLYSVSGSMFNRGVSSFAHKKAMVATDRWRVDGNTLIIDGGLTMLAGVKNEISLVIEKYIEVGQSAASDDFNIFGEKVNVQYGVHPKERLEKMVFLA